jgi:hypothetical protein
MFQMSREVKDAAISFLDLFKHKGIARYAGENVFLASEEVLGVCKRLDAHGALQNENVNDVATGLLIVLNARFRQMFQLLQQLADLHVLHQNLTTVCAVILPPWNALTICLTKQLR